MLLLMALSSLIGMAIAGSIPMPAQPGAPTPDPAMVSALMRVTMIGSAVVYAALAAWAIATLVGLIRMRTWARISVMIIGGGLVVIGIGGALLMLVVQSAMGSMQMPPGQDPAILHVVMIVGAIAWLAISGLGVWWVIYFALRDTREAFALAASPQRKAGLPVYTPYGAAQYQVAEYQPATAPMLPVAAMPEPPAAVPITAPGRPLAITVLAWLYIAAAAMALPMALMPIPLFFLGVTLSGLTGHLAMLCFGVITGLAGFGLLRLERLALYAAFALNVLGLVNSALMFLPSYRDRMIAYQQNLIVRWIGMPLSPGFDSHTMGLMMIPGMIFGILVCLGVLLLLLYYRKAFNMRQAAAV